MSSQNYAGICTVTYFTTAMSAHHNWPHPCWNGGKYVANRSNAKP